jgi:hypothetical protein
VPTLERERPERMYQRGRVEDPEFDPGELLYRRYLKEHWIDGIFSNTGFSFPKQSVNRQKYSEPEDVLFLPDGTFDDERGVLEFAVRDIPLILPEGGGPAFVFFPKHVPEEVNFAHSEVWCDRAAKTGEYVEPNRTVKKLLRTKLSQRVFIRIPARK